MRSGPVYLIEPPTIVTPNGSVASPPPRGSVHPLRQLHPLLRLSGVRLWQVCVTVWMGGGGLMRIEHVYHGVSHNRHPR